MKRLILSSDQFDSAGRLSWKYEIIRAMIAIGLTTSKAIA